MRLLAFTKERLQAFIAETEHLRDSDFPYGHSKAALGELHRLFSDKLAELNALPAGTDDAVIKEHCAESVRLFFNFLPLIGFVLRSTNVRNAFEEFRPLLHLAEQVLEPTVPPENRTTRLLLSSEWEYAPLTFPRIPDLPGFVFLGFPAPESGNPLLLPLAGHEFGHPVWLARDLENIFRPLASQNVVHVLTRRWAEFDALFGPTYAVGELATNIEAVTVWQHAADWCLSQAEETFCDLLGFLLFGESFLHSFGYLMAPGRGWRSFEYPALRDRATRLAAWADQRHIPRPRDYAELFTPSSVPGIGPQQEFMLDVADQALLPLIPELQRHADTVINEAGIPVASETEKTRVMQRFKLMVPAEACVSVADVLNAAWAVTLDDAFWTNSSIPPGRRSDVLKDLVLKNLEVMEIERIQATA